MTSPGFYQGAACTLDGNQARILMSEHAGFVLVATLPTGPAYEWSYAAAERIMADGGRFKS